MSLNSSVLYNIGLPIVFLAAFYFLVIRPQQKREKAIREMRNSISIGDEIVTIGGIVGKVIKINDEQITIEVGSTKTRLNIEKWGIGKKL